jgi:hypothetical protein
MQPMTVPRGVLPLRLPPKESPRLVQAMDRPRGGRLEWRLG